MKTKEFKAWFADFSAGIPVTGTNGAQWKQLLAKVEALEVEPVVTAPKTK